MPGGRITLLLGLILLFTGILAGCGPAKGTAEWHNNQGYELLNKGRYDDVIEELNKAIELDSDYAEPYINRGLAYRGKGQLERAIRDFDEAIRLNPQRAKTYYSRGITYKEQGDKARAIAVFEKFISLTDETCGGAEIAQQQIEELSK